MMVSKHSFDVGTLHAERISEDNSGNQGEEVTVFGVGKCIQGLIRHAFTKDGDVE
ncbi:MAG: hypothetical protein R3F37_07560 [Candidatus Competibacteraceae bacterium]